MCEDKWTKCIHPIGLWNEACGTSLFRCWLIWIPSYQWPWGANYTGCWEIKTNDRNAGLWCWLEEKCRIFNVHTEWKFSNLIEKIPPTQQRAGKSIYPGWMKDWVNSAGIRTCGSRDPRYFGSDSWTTQMAGGKLKRKIAMWKGPYLAEVWIWIPCMQLTPCRHICTNQRGCRTGCCYPGKSETCTSLPWECVCFSGLSRALALTLNHISMFFFCVPDHFENLWFYTIFCLGDSWFLFFYVSPLILNRQLTAKI